MSLFAESSPLRFLLFSFVAFGATVVDLRERRIPDIFSLGGLVLLLAWDFFFERGELGGELLAGMVLVFLLALARALTKGLGLGDLKYAAFIAVFAGFPACLVALFASGLCGLGFFAFALATKHLSLKDSIPFAPFLTAGALAAIPFRLGGLSL